MKISREEEDKIPGFKSEDEAVEWFVQKYGKENFVFDDFGSQCNFYHLIIDQEDYQELKRLKREGKFIYSNTPDEQWKLMDSYQQVEISKEGYVHIIH